MRKTHIKGKMWVLGDPGGELYDDVDTDMIFHNRYLHITNVEEMGQYALDNLQGWEDFSKKAQAGDIIVVGRNFGSGSSRQQAVDCFQALGIAAIVAESFGAIYKRNAINSGMPIVSFPGLTGIAAAFQTGSELELDFATGAVVADGKTYRAEPFSLVQMDIYLAGNLFEYGKTIGA
jgi:3-isopropylmalate dehydratase small subunit